MRTNKLAVALALCVLTVSGCKKKKQVQTLPPPPVTAPTSTVRSPAQQPPTIQPLPPQTAQQNTPPKTTPKQSKPKSKPHIASKRKPSTTEPPATTAKNSPPRITVDPGSLPDSNGSVASSVPHSQETDERRPTDQLVQSTEDNLRSITRPLTDEEISTVAKIRSFISQSQAATKEGDLVRAHNLALKAHLLSDDLAKR